jgi:hypothetical protein
MKDSNSVRAEMCSASVAPDGSTSPGCSNSVLYQVCPIKLALFYAIVSLLRVDVEAAFRNCCSWQ